MSSDAAGRTKADLADTARAYRNLADAVLRYGDQPGMPQLVADDMGLDDLKALAAEQPRDCMERLLSRQQRGQIQLERPMDVRAQWTYAAAQRLCSAL